MSESTRRLEARIATLEQRLRRDRRILGVALCAVVSVALVGFTGQDEKPSAASVLKGTSIVIVDDEGRERMFFGALPDPKEGRRSSASFGFALNDEAGHERFAYGLKSDGSMTMGFDCPPGVGDPRNRERLNLGVTSSGHGFIRFLDNTTRAKLYIGTDRAESAWLTFLNWSEKGVTGSMKYGLEQKYEPRGE